MLPYKIPGTVALLLLSAGVYAQAGPDKPLTRLSDLHHLLWFTGHWNKDKKNVFVIEGAGDSTTTGAGSPGGTIVVDPDGTLHPHTGGADAWNKWVDKAITSEDKFIQDLNNPQENLDPSTHQLYQLLLPDAEERKQQLTDYKIDPKEDMLTGEKPAAVSKPARSLTDATRYYCKSVKSDYDEVMNYYSNHVKGHKNDLNVPLPPAFGYNCYACDSNLRKSDDTTVEHYVRDFLHPEDSIVRKGFRILHELSTVCINADQGMDGDVYDALFSVNKKDPSKSGACSFLSPSDLSRALYETAYHLYERAVKLVLTNQKNFKAAKAILRTYLSIARDWALVSGSDEGFETMKPDLESLIKHNIDFYHDAFTHNDWRTIGNIPYLLSLYRDFELLGGSDENFQNYLTRLLKICNGFKLSVEMDIKIGKDDGYRIAHLKGDCHIIPFFQKDSNQCYKWVVADGDRQDILGFYKPDLQQNINCQLLDNEMTTPPNAPKIVYNGTRKYIAVLESLSMDFCNPGHDSIALTGFLPNPNTAGTWQFPYAGLQNLGVNGLEQFFEDVMAKKKLVDDGEAQKEANNMQKQGEDIQKQMESLKAQMNGSQGAVSYEKVLELMNKARALTTTAVAAKMLYLDFLLPVQNNDPVLVDKKFDAKQINPRESAVVVYGYYTIHIENKGNGKARPVKK